MKWFVLVFIVIMMELMMVGCGVSPTYRYRAITDNCDCEDYRTTDSTNRIEYTFHGYYQMQGGVVTSIEVTIVNLSRDTLFLEQGYARISSRNINYQYNNKRVPLPPLTIIPLRSENFVMMGNDISGEDDWNKIAGEQLTLTIQGILLGARTLPQQTVTFIPDNPKLKKPGVS